MSHLGLWEVHSVLLTLQLVLVFSLAVIRYPSAGAVTEAVGHSAGIYAFSGTLPPGALTTFPGWLWFPSWHRSFLGLVLLIEVSTPHSWVEASVAF